MANHVMTDLLNHGVHWRRRWHEEDCAAHRGLPFFSGRLRFGAVGSADGGDRTHTHLRELDFESSASANSATSAFVRRQLVSTLPRNARANEGRIQELQEFRSTNGQAREDLRRNSPLGGPRCFREEVTEWISRIQGAKDWLPLIRHTDGRLDSLNFPRSALPAELLNS